MDGFRIDDDDRSLELTCVRRAAGGDAVAVSFTIRGPGLEATVTADGSELGFEDLEEFFAELLYSWQGFTGEVRYQSFEHDVRLRARHDGRVHLAVDLAPLPNGSWRAQTELTVDPADLTAMVAGVTRVLGSRLNP